MPASGPTKSGEASDQFDVLPGSGRAGWRGQIARTRSEAKAVGLVARMRRDAAQTRW